MKAEMLTDITLVEALGIEKYMVHSIKKTTENGIITTKIEIEFDTNQAMMTAVYKLESLEGIPLVVSNLVRGCQ